MRRKVRKKPDQEPEKEPVVIMVDKEKMVENQNEKEKMSPVEKERQGMKTEEPGKAMTPLKK